MKTICALFVALFFAGVAHAVDQIYVTTVADVKATLSNGLEFTAQTGDMYPFVAFDSSQTLVQLKFGPFTFWARRSNVAFVSEADSAAAAKQYAVDTTRFFAAWKAAVEQSQKAAHQPLEADSAQQMRSVTEFLQAMQALENQQQQEIQNLKDLQSLRRQGQ